MVIITQNSCNRARRNPTSNSIEDARIREIKVWLEEVAVQETQNKNTIYVSKESLKFPLIVRKWQNGDYFYPTGMIGKKKLSKYFKDEKSSLLEKNNTWLLCNADNAIIWIVGMRKDSRFKVKSDTEITKIYLK